MAAAAPFAVLLVLLGSLAPASAQSSGSAGWLQFQGGPDHPGETADAGGGPAPPYRVRWTFPAPDGTSLSAAVLVDGTAIAIGREAVYGVELSTGQKDWEVPRDGGPLSVPAVGELDGRQVLLYLEGPAPGGAPSPTSAPTPTSAPPASPTSASPDEGKGTETALVALDLRDRSERWRIGLGATARSGVTVDGDTIYVGDQSGTVHAVALDDGAERWTTDLVGHADLPLAVGEGIVYAVSRDPDGRRIRITALDASGGEQAWSVSPQIGSTAASAPSATSAGVVIATADRLVQVLDAEDGEQRWATLLLSLSSPVSAPATGGDDVLVADIGGGLYRLDPADGARRWGFQFNELVLRSSPVRSGGAVLVGLNDGGLAAVDLEHGRLVWEGATGPGLVGTMAVSRDTVVAVKGGPDAGLIAFEHDPDGTLVDVASPTELTPGTTLARAGLAALAVFAAAFVPALLARRRFGDALVPEDAGGENGDDLEEGGE
jgi:outer membrane protein assembly factor BamB